MNDTHDIQRAEAALALTKPDDGINTVALAALLKQARAWNESVTGMAIGGGPFNTEVSRLLLAAHIQLLETLVEGKPTTKLPSRHHA